MKLRNYLTEEDTFKERILKWIDSLGDPITIYRAVEVSSHKDINMNNLGVYWTADKDKADSPYRKGNFDQIIIKGQVKRKDVDEFGTISTMRQYPEEREIRVKPGTRIKTQFGWGKV